MSDFLSFTLPDEFIKGYKKREPDWGFDIGGGNKLGELVYLTKYSRRKEDGTKERWYETCRRCIEGMYSILKDHCVENRTPWNEYKAQRAAQDAYERMFTFKWTPPGRGLWMMGTRFVHENRNSAALQNCAFVSTEKLSTHSVREATLPFIRLMEMSMLGVGVGFDTQGAGNLELHSPSEDVETFVIEDSREGWYESLGKLLESYFFKNRSTVQFDYDQVRPAGEPIKGFGGVASGPGPLKNLHENVRRVLDGRAGERLTSRDIVDLMNMIGCCVVAGNVRRSAELALGNIDDNEFLNLKNYDENPERADWGWASNNSLAVKVGSDLDHLVDRIADNGEPGFLWLDLVRSHGRLIDPPNYADHRVVGTNPCGEQSLESFEMCTLVETFPYHHEDLADYKKTLKHAYLYGKAVTLLPTHWPEANEIMQRNRRIGCSMSGIAQFVEHRSHHELREWMDEGYEEVQKRDKQYSEWLGVRESIKTTSIKPSGTVSLLCGATPGVHWPTMKDYIRRIRVAKIDTMVDVFAKAGYRYEDDLYDPSSVVFEFPVLGYDVRDETQVSMWEKAELAVTAQRWWADNQVSVTVTFGEHERDQIGPLLRTKDGTLKSLSMLPITEAGSYKQMPYEAKTRGDIEKLQKKAKVIDWKPIYETPDGTADAEGERYCTTDKCELPVA